MATETKSNAPNAADTRHQHQILTGRVTSAKMEKTIVVEVLRLVQHPMLFQLVPHEGHREAGTVYGNIQVRKNER